MSDDFVYRVVYATLMIAGLALLACSFVLVCCALSWLACILIGYPWNWTIGLATSGIVLILKLLFGGGK